MDAHDFVSLSVKKAIAPRSAVPLIEIVKEYLSDYLIALDAAGCGMVGHIKGVMEDGGSPPLFFSVTSLGGESQFKGGPLAEGKDLTLSMTTIVSGLDEEVLSRLLEDSLARHFIYGKEEREDSV
jgi:hypothetical protein